MYKLIEIPNTDFVRIERDHDFGGTVSYFHLNKDRASNPAAGSINVSHEAKTVSVNVTLHDQMQPEQVIKWSDLIRCAAEFCLDLES